jgi:tripartite-type tricarboxylate transporter receptor subunit TctC
MRLIPCLVALCLLFGAHARAQDTHKDAHDSVPGQPIRIIVGNAAGGGNDILARLVGQKLSDRLGQPVIVENKPGASGIVAAQYVAKAAPDGTTLLVAPIGMLVVNPAVMPDLPYDPQRDFAPISIMASFPLVLAVNAATPVRTVAELLAFAKAEPAKANAGGSGVVFQVVQKMFELETGSQFQYVGYRSTTDALTALLRGELLMSLSDIGPIAGSLKDGRVRALAVTSGSRLPAWPQVPTMTEAGVTDMEISFWSGLVAPAGTPQAVVKTLQDNVMAVMQMPDVRSALEAINVVPVGSTADEFAARIAHELPMWSEVARSAHIRVEQ